MNEKEYNRRFRKNEEVLKYSKAGTKDAMSSLSPAAQFFLILLFIVLPVMYLIDTSTDGSTEAESVVPVHDFLEDSEAQGREVAVVNDYDGWVDFVDERVGFSLMYPEDKYVPVQQEWYEWYNGGLLTSVDLIIKEHHIANLKRQQDYSNMAPLYNFSTIRISVFENEKNQSLTEWVVGNRSIVGNVERMLVREINGISGYEFFFNKSNIYAGSGKAFIFENEEKSRIYYFVAQSATYAKTEEMNKVVPDDGSQVIGDLDAVIASFRFLDVDKTLTALETMELDMVKKSRSVVIDEVVFDNGERLLLRAEKNPDETSSVVEENGACSLPGSYEYLDISIEYAGRVTDLGTVKVPSLVNGSWPIMESVAVSSMGYSEDPISLEWKPIYKIGDNFGIVNYDSIVPRSNNGLCEIEYQLQYYIIDRQTQTIHLQGVGTIDNLYRSLSNPISLYKKGCSPWGCG